MSTLWDSALARLNVANRDTFGVSVSWTHGSLSTDITVVRNAPSNKEESSSPNYLSLWALSSDVPEIERGDTVLLSSTLYRVLDADPDGGGGINLTLEKTTA